MKGPVFRAVAAARGIWTGCGSTGLAPVVALAVVTLAALGEVHADQAPAADPRLRTVLYSADEVYRLPGHVGYDIDLQFESVERFVGLGAGDVDGLSFAAQANHLFIKPRAANVRTNITVITSLRTYHFDYVTLGEPLDSADSDVVYALRFLYPSAQVPRRPAPAPPQISLAKLLTDTSARRHRNADYWYCGRPELRPVAAWDDGIQTHLRFGLRAELPAMFVLNDDGSEALVDYHVEQDELVAHRVARRFVLRRGHLTGCVVNHSYIGSGEALPSGTLSPEVHRMVRQEVP